LFCKNAETTQTAETHLRRNKIEEDGIAVVVSIALLPRNCRPLAKVVGFRVKKCENSQGTGGEGSALIADAAKQIGN
jgi:hypothetical protein